MLEDFLGIQFSGHDLLNLPPCATNFGANTSPTREAYIACSIYRIFPAAR